MERSIFEFNSRQRGDEFRRFGVRIREREQHLSGSISLRMCAFVITAVKKKDGKDDEEQMKIFNTNIPFYDVDVRLMPGT
jgi:hypothetical protein